MAHLRPFVPAAAAVMLSFRFAAGAVLPLDEKRPTIVRVTVAARPLAPGSDRQLLQMMQEAEAIWRPYGVALTWIAPWTVGPVSPADVSLRLEFVVRAREAGPSSRPSEATALGAIRFLDGDHPDEIVRISALEVERVVLKTRWTATPPESLPPALLDEVLGRALGRVFAHELGHYLLAFNAHTTAGLMRPLYPGPELAGWDRQGFRLDACARDRLRTRIGYLVGGSGPQPGFALPGCNPGLAKNH